MQLTAQYLVDYIPRRSKLKGQQIHSGSTLFVYFVTSVPSLEQWKCRYHGPPRGGDWRSHPDFSRLSVEPLAVLFKIKVHMIPTLFGSSNAINFTWERRPPSPASFVRH